MNGAVQQIRAGVMPVDTWSPPPNGCAFFRYVDISSVDRERKCVVSATELDVKHAPSRARQLLNAGDVLVSTVRPNLNAVAMVPTELDGTVGSTGFAVLRANPKLLLPRYLFHWVRTPMFVADMVRKATGASYPAVSNRIVLDSEIPVPSLDEQRRIAEILDKADAIRCQRKETIALTDELVRSTFLEMFGDPVANPQRWPLRPVTKLCASRQYGTADKANTESIGQPVLRMGNLTYNGDVELSNLKWVELSTHELNKLDLRDGDVLFNRVNSHELVGKTAVWHHGPGFTFAGYLIRLRMRPELAIGDYVATAMNMPSIKAKLAQLAKPSINMANISGSDLDRLSITVPPLALQSRFSDIRRSILALRDRYCAAAENDDALFNTLVARAFSGTLEASC